MRPHDYQSPTMGPRSHEEMLIEVEHLPERRRPSSRTRVKIGKTDPFVQDDLESPDYVATRYDSPRPDLNWILAGLGVLVACGLFLKFLGNRSDPQFLLYALAVANAVPFVWNAQGPIEEDTDESRRGILGRVRGLLREVIDHLALTFAAPLLWSYRKRIQLPEGITWTDLGFAACHALAVLLACQVVYRMVYKTWRTWQTRLQERERVRQVTFPRL